VPHFPIHFNMLELESIIILLVTMREYGLKAPKVQGRETVGIEVMELDETA
jgi:hypothetical protein